MLSVGAIHGKRPRSGKILAICHVGKMLEKVPSLKQVHLPRKLVALPSRWSGGGRWMQPPWSVGFSQGHEVRLGLVPRGPAPGGQGGGQSLAASLLGQPSRLEPAALSGVGLRGRAGGRGDAGRDSSR